MRVLGASLRARIRCALVSAVLASFIPATVALGHTPVVGAAKNYASSIELAYKWGASTYPAWFRTSMVTAFESDWSARAFNNSQMPTFTYSATGAGTVSYASTTGVPACDAVAWIGCSSNWGRVDWKAWIRSTVSWADSGSCNSPPSVAFTPDGGAVAVVASSSCPSGKASCTSTTSLAYSADAGQTWAPLR